MTEESDYEDILDNNVSEAKKAIRDLEDPDFGRLLEIEKDNKDRKTIREFLDSKIENTDESDEVEDEETEEVAEEIEHQTEGGLFGSFSRRSLVTGGLVFGLLLGLIAGLAAPGFNTGDAQMAEDTVTELLEASGFNGDIEFSESTQRSGMYYVSADVTPEGANESQSRSFYLTKDGKYLFPEVQSPFITTPINVDEFINRLEQRQQSNQTTGSTGNTTSP